MIKCIICICVALFLSSCGTYVPNLRSFPTKNTDALLIQNITQSIKCEFRTAVADVFEAYKNPPRIAEFLMGWKVTISLTLTVVESSSINPNAIYTPSTLFALRGGGSISNTATQIRKFDYSYNIADLRSEGKCSPASDPKDIGSQLVQSNLKIKNSIFEYLTPVATGSLGKPASQKAFSHQVRFQAIGSGNLSPAWVLTEFNVNGKGNVFTASRNTTHDFIAQFGQIDPSTGNLQKSAADSLLASQIGVAIRQGGF